MSNTSTNDEDSPAGLLLSLPNATNSTNLHATVWGSLNYSLPTLIVVAIVLFLVIVATAFGNFLVVLALFKYRSLRTISNYLIGNLALSDFLLATTILPLSTVNECLGHWVFGQGLCNAWLITDVLYCTASIWNIFVIAFDRFTATVCPIWYRETRSTKKAAIYIALVWLISCAVCLPPVVGWNDLSQNYKYDRDRRVYRCVLFETKSYVLYSACGSFYIPFFMTFVFYMAIFIALRDRMLKTRRSRMSTTAAAAAAAARTVAESHRKTPDKKRSSSSSSSGAKDKSHRLQKEYKFEMVNIVDDRKEDAGADETSSKSLFGSDSEREKSASDAETDVIVAKTAMTSQTTEAADVTHRPATRGVGVTTTRDLASSNGFAQMTCSGALVDQPTPVPTTVEEDGTAPTGTQPLGLLDQPDTSHPTATTKTKTAHPKAAATPVAAAAAAARRASSVEQATPGRAPFAPKTPARETVKRNRRYEQREMRATIRMAIIIAFFCAMWVGFFTVYVLNSWCTGCRIPRELEAFFFWLGYSNSSINPILYTIFNDDFRKAFMQIMGCHVIRDFAMATYNRFSLNSP